MIKAVVFDLDDTLLMTRQTRFAAIQHAGKHFYDLDLSASHIELHWGKPFHEFISAVFYNAAPHEEIAKNYTSIVHKFPNTPYHDAVETLHLLFSDYAVGVLSSASRHLVRNDIANAGLPVEKFVAIQAAEDTSIHKPDPAVFLPMLEQLSGQNILPHQIVYVGDRVEDFQAANGAGLHFIGMADRSVPKSAFDNVNAQWVTSLSELPGVIKQLHLSRN